MTDEAKTVDVLIVAGPHAGRVVQVRDISPLFDLVIEPRLTTLEDALNRGPIERVRYEHRSISPFGGKEWRVATPINESRTPASTAFDFAMGVAWSEAPLVSR
jgi:hypothetical protein